jgi:transketolase
MNQEVAEFARNLRALVLEMVTLAGSGHVAGALGMAEVYALLYREILHQNPEQPSMPDRDRLIVSCGHTAPARYAAMALSGYFPTAEVLSLRRFGSRLQGHPSTIHLPGLETDSGSLGQGLSQALGMALEARRTQQHWHTYCILSDGEHQEGQTWEAVQYAGAKQPANLTAIIDRNGIQIDGRTEVLVPLRDIAAQYAQYHWEVSTVAGHDIDALRAVFNKRSTQQGPHCIVVETTPGKGVSFMEDAYQWHGKAPTRREAREALMEVLQ